jgi:hypothetical protein
MPPKPFFRHCLKCGNGFSTFEESKIYCHDVCQSRDKAARTAREEGISEKTIHALECPGCNAYFIPKNHEKYCNWICSQNAAARKRRAEKRKNKLIDKTCPECKSNFTAYASNIKYCSNICAQQVAQRNFQAFKAKKREENAKAGKKKRQIPYRILNAMAEKKRLDEEWDRLTR